MKVSLVGAGPGDPGLLTIKGQTLLAEADVVVYDALASEILLKHAKPEAEKIYVGKVASRHALPQDGINELLVAKARANGGQKVVRLKGGDPYVFGRGGEEAEYLAQNNIPFEEVPGISSAIAAPAYAGIPVTHRGLTSSLTIITGHENPHKGESAINWQALAQSGSTLVFVMGMKNLPDICRNLISCGLAANTPAAIVYRGTTPAQRVLQTCLQDLPAKAEKEGFTNPSVIVIGKVAALSHTLDWFSKKPLLGRNIAVTRAREQASGMVEALAALGANVIECPAIKTEPMEDYAAVDAAIAHIKDYSWIIFTSVNGVDYFWKRLATAGMDSRALANARIAAIGPATAAALYGRGIVADLVPETYVAESVAEELLEYSGSQISGMRILLPRAARARMILPDTLAKAGAVVDVVPLYKTIPDATSAGAVEELLKDGKLDCVAFGSSSTVENFLRLVPEHNLAHSKTILAAIGPVTAATLADHGLRAHIIPQSHTIPDLVKAIAAHFTKHGEEGRQ